MKKSTIGIFVGSLRKGSFNGQVARVFASMLPDDFEVKWMDLGKLPMYNQDLDEGNTPAEWTEFRQEVKALDGVLFFTPEYNRSFPPVLKNALDIASRPMGQNAWDQKPGAIISVTPGKMGGFGANHHLRQVASFLNIYMMQQPEMYIGGIGDVLDADGRITDAGTKAFIESGAKAYAKWVKRFVI